MQIYGVETPGSVTSGIPIHLLHLLHLPPKAPSYAQLTIIGVNLPQMTDPSTSSSRSFSDGNHHSYRAGLVSSSFSLICIFMIFVLAFHAFRSFLVGQNGIVCHIMMRRHLFAAWIKRKDRNRMFYAEKELRKKARGKIGSHSRGNFQEKLMVKLISCDVFSY